MNTTSSRGGIRRRETPIHSIEPVHRTAARIIGILYLLQMATTIFGSPMSATT